MPEGILCVGFCCIDVHALDVHRDPLNVSSIRYAENVHISLGATPVIRLSISVGWGILQVWPILVGKACSARLFHNIFTLRGFIAFPLMWGRTSICLSAL